MKRKVVITGMGIVCCLGDDVERVAEQVAGERSGLRPISWVKEGQFRNARGGEVEGVEEGAGEVGRCRAFVRRAAEAATRQAGLELTPAAGRIGISLGTNFGDVEAQEAFYGASTGAGAPRPDRGGRDFHAITRDVAARLALRGPKFTCSTACASGVNAIGIAFDLIRYGRADAMIAGAYDVMCTSNYSGLNALHAITLDTIRPFDAGRSGTLLGEGAGVVVLEAEEVARARGAPALAEVLGYGMNNNAHHLTAPHRLGIAEVMRKALDDAGLEPAAVDCVNAHGTGTKYNDADETRAVKEVFGDHARRLTITALKPFFGHTMGAAGSIEVVTLVQAMRSGVVPRVLNHRSSDAQCDLGYAVGPTERRAMGVALCNSYGFGGNNSAIVLRRCAGEAVHAA